MGYPTRLNKPGHSASEHTDTRGLKAEAGRAHDERRSHLCDRCGAAMRSIHCKIRCEHCGFMRDCSDP